MAFWIWPDCANSSNAVVVIRLPASHIQYYLSICQLLHCYLNSGRTHHHSDPCAATARPSKQSMPARKRNTPAANAARQLVQVMNAGPKDMRMYYHSWDKSQQRFVVGLATSPDGFRWTRQGALFDPVKLGAGPASHDAKGAAACHVVSGSAYEYMTTVHVNILSTHASCM